LALGAAIGGVFLYLALKNLNLSQAGAILAKANPALILLGVASLMLDYAMRAFRWHVMLRSVGSTASYPTAFRIFLASVAMNNVLPFRAGDVARTFSYRRDLNVTSSQVLGTMVVERLLDFLSLLFVFFVALVGLPEDRIPARYLDTARIALVAMLVLLAALLILAKPVRARLEGKGRIGDAVASFLRSVEQVAPFRTLLILIGLSLPAWLLESGLFIATAMALGIDVPIGGPMLSMATGTLATLIPSTPGYVGTFDAAAAEGIKAYGVAATPATVFALTAHVVLWIPLTVVGFGLASLHSFRSGTNPIRA
jgi:uncharacterized protein (TIRG00374 family)